MMRTLRKQIRLILLLSTVALIFFFLMRGGSIFDLRAQAQKSVTHADGSTTTTSTVELGGGRFGTKETTKDKKGNKTKEEIQDEKGNVIQRVEYGANGTERLWRYDRLGRVVLFVMEWTHGGPFGESGAIGREIKYKDDQDTSGTANDAARAGGAGARRATDDESTFIGVAIKPDPLATPKPGSNEGPGKEQPAINVESLINDLFPSEKKKQSEQETPKSGTTESQTPTQPAPQPSPKFQIDPTYKFEFSTSPGLNTETLVLPGGARISANFPNDMSGGDTISGTVISEVTGKDEKQRKRNQAELEACILVIGGQSLPATEKMFTRTLPANTNPTTPFFVVMCNGKQAVSATVPIAQTPPPAPQNAQLPNCGQIGKNVVVRDHCDGIIAPTDSCSIGGTQLQPLAESPRLRVLQNTSQTPGQTEIKYTEQGNQVSGPFMNLGVKLTSPNTNLLRGQKTTLEVIALAKGIKQDVSLDLVNDMPGIVSISGGDNQHFTIHPADVRQDGTYKQTFTVTADQSGAWGATATVSCVSEAPSGPIAGGPQATGSPSNVGRTGGVPNIPPDAGHPPPTPTPTPHTSPSPCASPPPPTTYSVMNLGPLSESDSAACRATGVNDAGNVIGVCSPSYFGISGGASHAFRTETGKVIDKEKDDLGLPAGITSGGAFATGINADGHVVGYWTSGADKAFWHDGSRKGESSKYAKMIDLHPGKSFTTSKAFAVNKDDDVVGAAFDPKVGPGSALGITFGGHAVIWLGADAKKMKDLNEDLDASIKKDWILIVAFGINDDGDIVGRALNKKLGKFHAFLLKGVGGKFFDLGALKEDMVDSSAAYAINECGEKVPAIDKVVGYTLTTTSVHYGFIWTEASGLMDFGALPAYSSVPYAMESYGQAINKKGEVVGASGPSYYTSYFEGLGAGPGLPGGLCVPSSHALWYNGSELKDLNKLIPDSPGWELDLANGINDKGLIAGSGYYKCFGPSSGSAGFFTHFSHAVLLTPAGLTSTASGPGSESSSTAKCPLSLPSGGYIFDNWNICGVKNAPTKDTTFTIGAPYLITFIATYHWNYSGGALPGGKGISLKSSDGTVYGPWPVTTSPGSGGAANVNWECHPGITLPAGTYTVVDPDPATWSQNDGSGNSGFVRVAGSTTKK